MGGVDLGECNFKLCHSLGAASDLPNWRRVSGFPVYGVGQPTEKGFANIPEKVGKEKTIWFNCRQEPVAYIGGQSVTPRAAKNPHENIECGDCQETTFISAVKSRKCEDGKVDITRDKAEADNPMDREEVQEKHELVELKGFTSVLSGMADGPIPGMSIVRIPILEEKALPESALDTIVQTLKDENPAKTQCIFSSQLGQGRTTFGMVAACIVKAVQMSTKLQCMVQTGIGSKEWADGIIKKTFEELTDSEDLKDTYLMGEFEVVKELLEKMPAFRDGKQLADKMIDLCGTPPEGTGIQNLRKCIIQTKYKYDAATEDRQAVWKKMIINFIERYFYLICFATYAKEQGPTMFPKSFVAWMDEHKDLREMIANGKDKLEWSRQVDQNAVNELRGKVSGADYKDKLGEVVTSLYKISHTTYSDMPRGVIKDTLMRKLTCKTLMEILPTEVVGKIQKEMAEKKLTSDFETVVGLVVAA